MVAYSHYLAATASISSVYARATPLEFRHAPECNAQATVTVTQYASARPTTNAHGHGGPYYNKYNDLPLPFEWPGTPKPGEVYPPPQPPTPFSYGGPAKGSYDAPGWVPKGSKHLDPSLPSTKQCGNSQWGLVDNPHLPPNGLPGGHNWGYPGPSHPGGPSGVPHPSQSGGHSNIPLPTFSSGHLPNATHSVSMSRPTNVPPFPTMSSNGSGIYTPGPTGTPVADRYCPTMPDTGVTRTYDLHVAYQTIAPDGVTRNGLTVNGQFPGPLIEANWGDWILWRVTNDLTDEGTTLHAHGLFQTNTSWYDGVPAVAQCPITPNGGYMEMLFRADRFGSSWYHSHYSAQYSGGAHGPMVIHGPKFEEYDIDIGPVILEDWYHADYYSLVEKTMAGRFPPSNNNLINGRMNYPCANTTLPCVPNAGVSKFKFQSGKKHLLRLANMGAEGIQKFSIDGHVLKVIAVDFVPIEPYTTNVVTVAVGQRSDVIVEAVGKPGDSYWMRSQLAQGFRCTLDDGISPNALAAVYYEDADTNDLPTTTSDVTQDQLEQCKDDPINMSKPLCKIPLEEPDHTEVVTFDFRSNGTNFIWYLNNSTYRGDYNSPTLLIAKKDGTTFPPESNVYQFPGAKNVRIHLINNAMVGGHPMHLHGHDFHVLAEGYGAWDGTITNPENTLRRDVHQMTNARNVSGVIEPSYMVLQFTQDNPGAWPLHCHLAWHVSGGLFMQILERPDDIRKQDFDEDVFQICDKWAAFTSDNFVNQIDSGL